MTAKRKYPDKRRHWRGWPKVLAWIFLAASSAVSLMAFAETKPTEGSALGDSQRVRMIISSMLAVIGFLVRHWVYKNERTLGILFALRREDQKTMTAMERKLDLHIARCAVFAQRVSGEDVDQ